MKFELNGEARESTDPLSVFELLERQGLQGRRVAVAINAEVVPKSRFREVEIAEGDRIEVIQAVGGG